jgi:peptidoglycan hydrolase-like protein with peptidoglycan-binding domain
MRYRRAAGAALALVLVLAACGDDDAGTTEATQATVATSITAAAGGETTAAAGGETTAAPSGSTSTAALAPGGPAFIRKGETGAFVVALQHYLDCAGHGPLEIDGVFGDATAGAVEKAQAAEGKEATGEPDEAIFAALSRECDDPRDVTFPEGATSAEVAGNAAPGDPETFWIRVLEGQTLTLWAESSGAVDLTVQGADGEVLHRPDGSQEFAVDIPTSQLYAIEVASGAAASFTLELSVPALPEESTTSTAAQAEGYYLARDGLNEVDFGEGSGRTITALTDEFGPPAEDTDWFTERGTPDRPCAENARVIEWAFPGTEGMPSSTLEVVLHDGATDDPVFAYYRYYLTYGYDEAVEEGGFLSTASGLSVGHSYPRAVELGFQLGGFEELSVGLFEGIRVDVFTDGGTYEESGQVGSMQAGSWYCLIEEP